MDPLSTSRRTLTWLCIYPADKTVTWQKKMIHIIFTAFSIIFLGCSTITVLALGYKQVLFSALNVPAVIALIYTILSAFFLSQGIIDIFESLSSICNKCRTMFQSYTKQMLKNSKNSVKKNK